MIIYNVAVPIFSDEERVEFTVDTENAVITFTCEWWDDLWHCSTTIDNGDKRSCVLYPNVLYYPQDRTYSFKIVTTKPIIGLTDLSGLELIVGVSETFGSAVSAGITSEAVIDTPVEALFGSAAYRDVGIESAQIPLNSNLGSAAYRDVGSESAQIPLNSNLGSAAYKNVESIYLETNDPVAVDSMAIRDIRRYTKLTAYYSTGIAFTASGATFEGRTSISLYGQYSYVELERISATLFAVRDIEDQYTAATGEVSIRGKILEQWGTAGPFTVDTVNQIALPRAYSDATYALSGSVTPLGTYFSFLGWNQGYTDSIFIYSQHTSNNYKWQTIGKW